MRALWVVLVASVAAAAPAKPPRGITGITIAFTHSGYFGPDKDVRFALTWQPSGIYAGSGSETLSAASVDALASAMTDLHPSERQLTCYAMSDNNDVVTVTLSGAHSITMKTTSSCAHHLPWNVIVDGKRLYQATNAIDAQVMKLLVQLDPAYFSRRGTPMHGSTSFEVASAQSSEAKACAADVEATAKKLGAPLTYRAASLVCDAQQYGDCTTLAVRGSLQWNSVAVFGVEASCTAGKGAVSPEQLAALRPLFEGALLPAIVGLAKAGLNVRAYRTMWKLQGVPGLADVTYDPATKRVYTAGLPSPLWQALGITDVPKQPELTLDGKLAN